MNIVEKALIFATAAHAAVGQKRKYTNEDYIVHPIEVMEIVKTVQHTEAMLAAALLHDVVEDTSITLEQVREIFGDEVSDLVYWITDRSEPSDGNRKARKAIDRKHIMKAPTAVKTIKLADLISNTKSIVQYDKNFAETYLKEKMELLSVLQHGGDSILWKIAHELCTKSKQEIEEHRLHKALENLEKKHEM